MAGTTTVLVTGASGLVGAEVTARLTAAGHTVLALLHRTPEIVRNNGRNLTPGPGTLTRITGDRAYLADFDARRLRGEAVVRLTPTVLRKLPDLMEPAVARAARDSAGPPGPDGRVQVVMPIESAEHAVGMLLRLGAEAEVVAPAGLRALMTRTINALVDTYRDPLDKHEASPRLGIQR